MEHNIRLYDAIVSESIHRLHTQASNIIVLHIEPHNKTDLFYLKMALYAKLLYGDKKVRVHTPLWYFFSKELKFARKDVRWTWSMLDSNVKDIIDEAANTYNETSEIFPKIYEEFYND